MFNVGGDPRWTYSVPGDMSPPVTHCIVVENVPVFPFPEKSKAFVPAPSVNWYVAQEPVIGFGVTFEIHDDIGIVTVLLPEIKYEGSTVTGYISALPCVLLEGIFRVIIVGESEYVTATDVPDASTAVGAGITIFPFIPYTFADEDGPEIMNPPLFCMICSLPPGNVYGNAIVCEEFRTIFPFRIFVEFFV
jgi:hypothetical protein